MKTYAEQIEAMKATRAAKIEEMKKVAQTSMDGGRSMNDGESAQFDNLQAEIATLDADIKRISTLAEIDRASAKDVSDTEAREKTVTASVPVQVKNTEKLAPGIAFARAVKCLALGNIHSRDPLTIAKSLYDGNDGVIGAVNLMVTKATVAPAVTTNPEWAGNLVPHGSGVIADFVEFLRPQTILGKFGQGGIPGLRQIPFRVAMPGQTSGATGYWVGEAKDKPVTSFTTGTNRLDPLKVATIAVASMELVKNSSPAADMLIRDELVKAIAERMDIDFIDPAKAAVPGISPASILNGITALTSSGTNADAVRADVAALFGAFTAANNAPSTGVWIMPTALALQLSLMYTLAQREFPDIGIAGGRFVGLPVIVSDYMPAGTVALVNAQDVYYADDGDVEVSISREASLRMTDSPETDTNAEMVSLWQRNLIGFRAERIVNWARRRENGVAYMTGVNWKV